MSDKCPLCDSTLKHPKGNFVIGNDYFEAYNCPNCGMYGLEDFLSLHRLSSFNNREKVALSFFISNHQDKHPNASTLKIHERNIDKILEETDLPNPNEIADTLLQYIGDKLQAECNIITLDKDEFINQRAIWGVLSTDIIFSLINELLNNGYLDAKDNHLHQGFNFFNVNLTLKGWAKYDEIKRGAIEIKQGFMAMKFGDIILDKFFREHLKPAVLETGFKLKRLDEEPELGLIDDRLRIEIKRSKFLIADLTDGNNGAYWEAGYAEGLGKPVIYTCEKEYFNKDSTHFDTNHHYTLLWERENLDVASDELQATIRRTFPNEAKY